TLASPRAWSWCSGRRGSCRAKPCVPACVVMVLVYQGISMGEEELCQLLQTQPAGTPVWNVILLEQHLPGCQMEIDSWSLARLEEALVDGVPPIAFVGTGPLGYWERETLHA